MTQTNQAAIGHNHPPSPMDEVQNDLNGFLAAADIWQGATVDDETAPKLNDCIAGAKQLKKRADGLRAAEKKPHADAAKAVDDAWRPIIAACETVAATLTKAMTAYLGEQDRKRKAAEAEALRLAEQERARVMEAERKAAEATRASDKVRLQQEADAARSRADAEDARARAAAAPARVESATGGTRAMSFRTVRSATVENPLPAFGHLIRMPEHHARLMEVLTACASAEARAGRPVPGCTTHEERKPV